MPPRHPQSALQAPLNDILGTESNVRLLRVLALAEIPLGAGELARRAELGRTSIYPALAGLETAGIIEFIGAGSQRQIAFRKAHPLAKPLATLFRAESIRLENIVLALRALFAEIRPLPTSVWIGGPILTSEDRPGDSVGLSVVADPKALPGLIDHLSGQLEPIEQQFDVHVELHPLSRSELAARDRFTLEALRDAILVIGVPPTALTHDDDRARAVRNFRTHAEHDASARRLAAAISVKLKRDPSLASVARRQLARRAKHSSPQERRELHEWMRILSTMSPSRLQRFLVEPGEHAARLRQTLPALGLLTPAERETALMVSTEENGPAAARGRRQQSRKAR